ncbi:fumarylacetoacetate hydrolase family protein [Xanthobacter sp. KR7-225]|uniref:fumarylacetoacetate hydrolase family protein n=1 Tax=Xanthobacter sp. KR7-225 TaxID=3156613 RepID=UPI0032B5A053
MRAGALLGAAAPIDLEKSSALPILRRPGKIVCLGLNFRDHSAESGFSQPAYPTVFGRFSSSLVAHGEPIVRPTISEQLDYEGELAVVIGRGGRNIAPEDALDHVLGYSIFNDASVRDYQFKSPQWTVGKNFDGTGAFGPCLVTADELPHGCRGLRLQTRLNGVVVQDAMLDDMVFDVAAQISIVSRAMTLEPGDVFVAGTPSGVGLARTPPLWMKQGDVCEVEVTGIGILRNPVVEEIGGQERPAA